MPTDADERSSSSPRSHAHEDADATVTVHRDVPYRETPQATMGLDVYRPDGAERRPAVVVLHGGGWRTGSKGELARYALELAQREELVVVDVDYRLSDVATFPAQIADVNAAIRWARANAGDCVIDPDRIATMGHSAGAHLAALAGVTGDEAFADDAERDASSAVQAVVGASGIYDFTIGDEDREELVALLGETRDEAPARYRRASPRQRVDEDAPPTLLLHGDADQVVPCEQSTLFRDALRDAGADAELVVEEGGDHMFPHRNEHYEGTVERILAFLDRTL